MARGLVFFHAPRVDAKWHNAENWNVDSSKIGIMGFSAGGHLASTLGTHFDQPNSFEGDDIDKISARPDFMVLMYPVITFREPYAHSGSRQNLLGKDADAELVDYYSNERQIKPNTPPSFIVHSADDAAVPYQQSLLFYQALNDAGVPAEMHIYPTGGHGYSLALKQDHPGSWPELLLRWLQQL